MLSADVVHVGVDPVRRGLPEQFADRAVVVVVRATLAAEPALPTIRPAPRIRAIRPAAVPTPPAAAEMNRSSPGFSRSVRVSAT
jgi:hypothetical protein